MKAQVDDMATPAEGRDEAAPTAVEFDVADWRVQAATNHIARGDTEVRLEPKVMDVLVYLANRPGQVVSREELEAVVWAGTVVGYDTITGAIQKLRRALGDDPRQPRFIETLSKRGYRLVATVKTYEPSATRSTDTAQPPTSDPVLSRARSISRQSIAFLLLVLVLAAVAIGWLAQRSPGIESMDGGLGNATQTVVAVLPFDNLTGDPAQAYFANGITEDLITDLSKLSRLQVVARNSVLAYAGSEPASRIVEDLGAHFIVRGSVQRVGGRLRINVRLVDGIADRNRWAERYDRPLRDLFEIQDEIVARVVSALQVELAPGEQQRLIRERITSVEAYEQFLLGQELLARRASADNSEARKHFERAIELVPRFARAHAGLSMTYATHALYGFGPDVAVSLQRAEEIARRGLEIDGSVAELRWALSFVEMFKGNLVVAIEEISRAIELKPSYADGHGLLARILYYAGRTEEGLDVIERAISLNPRMPALYRTTRAALLYQLGENRAALDHLQTARDMSPTHFLTRLYLAAVYAATDQQDEARWEAEEILTLVPSFSLHNLEAFHPIRDPVYRERLLRDLRRAGIPER